MKKFEFSMQRVLEYKAHIEDNEKNTLKEMRRHHQDLCEQMEGLCKSVEEYSDEYNEKCSGGIILHEVIALRGYIDELQRQIAHIFALINESEGKIKLQLDKLISVSQEKNSMDKLKDKHWETYQVEARKKEEARLEEFVANSKIASKSKIG